MLQKLMVSDVIMKILRQRNYAVVTGLKAIYDKRLTRAFVLLRCCTHLPSFSAPCVSLHHNPAKMAEDAQLTSALNLMRRMPPSSVENSLAGLIELVPHLTDDLLNHVDQPLKVEKCQKTGKFFILCDYNRDGDSYR